MVNFLTDFLTDFLTNFLTYNLLTMASFRIGVPSILFVEKNDTAVFETYIPGVMFFYKKLEPNVDENINYSTYWDTFF